MVRNHAPEDVLRLLEDLKVRAWSISEAHQLAERAVGLRERGDECQAMFCEDASRAALRRASDIEQRTPQAAND